MSLVNLRDVQNVGLALEPWLRRMRPAAEHVALPTPGVPGEGGSSETFFLEPCFLEGGVERRESWVLRVQATGFQVYQDPSIERQHRVMQVLAERGEVPVPRVLWCEADPSILGAPFFIMERVGGELPPSYYHEQGLFAEAAPQTREALWTAAIEAMARVHRTDIAGFEFLARPSLGATGLDQEIAVWDAYVPWAGLRLQPIQERARRWLADHAPRQRPTGLAWGDARPGNMVFRDGACVAVIDWETASLAGAETDVAWWLFYDWLITEGRGAPRLPGLPDRAATIAAWEHFAGRRLDALEWHDVFAAWRFALIRDRALSLAGVSVSEALGGVDRDPVMDRLEALIA